MQAPIRWHADARRLRADGLTLIEIAERLGKSARTVRWVFAADRPAGLNKAVLKTEGGSKPPPRRPSAPPPSPPALSAGATLIEPHAPRVPRVILDRAGCSRRPGVRRRRDQPRRTDAKDHALATTRWGFWWENLCRCGLSRRRRWRLRRLRRRRLRRLRRLEIAPGHCGVLLGAVYPAARVARHPSSRDATQRARKAVSSVAGRSPADVEAVTSCPARHC